VTYERPPTSRVLEGIVTTIAGEPRDGSPVSRVNIAPMGPIVDEAGDVITLRPFKTSTTYRNLKATGQGVFHVTDDVLLLARAAIGQIQQLDPIPSRPATHVIGVVLTESCRYHELQVDAIDDRDDRTTITARVVHTDRLRDFFGFNRAMHAVLEAAILATRLHLTGADAVQADMNRLQILVDKTGGPRERMAMDELRQHIIAFADTHNT